MTRLTTRPHRSAAAFAALLLLGAACTDGDDGGGDAAAAEERGLDFDGPEDDLLGSEQLERVAFAVTATAEGDDLADLRFVHDGEDVTDDAERTGSTLTYAPDDLDDGQHTVLVTDTPAPAEADGGQGADGGDDGQQPRALHTWDVEVKATPPEVELTGPEGPVIAGEGVTVSGTTEPGATVQVGDEEVAAGEDGSFELEVAAADGELTVRVTDRAGNTTEVDEGLGVVASRVETAEVRTVHATFWAWATPSLRDPIEQMITDGRINSLQLDLKDEGGQIGYESSVELAGEIGSDIGPLDLEETVADLHERDVAVIGRIVAFADPPLASWAWENDRRDMVIQDNDGQDFYRGSYAGFSNFTHPDVIDYLLDLAEEAAQAGVDHILWDYIRRPEGLDNYTVPGLDTTPEEAIVEFTRQADERLAPYGVTHGASVYGIAADRPEQIGQDIPAMSEHLDYVAPMIYPSHWGPGEYDVADPNRQPYDIIRAILEVFEEAVEGTDTRVVPWLEDTPYRAWDRPHQVREQIRAAEDSGRDEWLMWNPGSTYTPEAYAQRD